MESRLNSLVTLAAIIASVFVGAGCVTESPKDYKNIRFYVGTVPVQKGFSEISREHDPDRCSYYKPLVKCEF